MGLGGGELAIRRLDRRLPLRLAKEQRRVAWNVGAVAAGWAGEALLDSYEQERRAVAQRSVDYSAARGEGMIRIAEPSAQAISTRSGPGSRHVARWAPARNGLGYTSASAAVGNLAEALRRVEQNAGAPGIDAMSTKELRPWNG
jgi:hypothetical protein